MKITDVRTHVLTAAADDQDAAWSDACIVEVLTDEGIRGVGEADSAPAVVKAVIDAPKSHEKSVGLREVVVGADPFDVEVLWNEMFERSYYYGRKGAAITALSAIDMALWDIIGKATGRPLYQLLGGKHREQVRAYASTLFPSDPNDLEHVTREAKTALEDGFTAIKFGWGSFGQDPVADDRMLERARETLGPDADLIIDAGMAWGHDVKQAIKQVRSLDRAHDLYWVEEPVYADNYSGYARISDACNTRVVGGENEYTAYGFRNFVNHGMPDGIQPDVARSGGITHMKKIASIASEHGIPFLPHGYGTPIIIAANLQLMAATNNAPLLEYTRETGPIRSRIITEEFPVEDGAVSVPDRPGLGVTLNRETIDTYSTDLSL